jgi:hypothetical protein
VLEHDVGLLHQVLGRDAKVLVNLQTSNGYS